MKTSTSTLVTAAALGFTGGLRTGLPLAFLSLQRAGLPRSSFARRPLVRKIAPWAAAAELLIDKVPSAGPRIAPFPLFARIASGALAGALLERPRHRVRSALAGAVAAAAGAFVGYHVRRRLVRRTRLPDPLWGGVEDLVALSVGAIALR